MGSGALMEEKKHSKIKTITEVISVSIFIVIIGFGIFDAAVIKPLNTKVDSVIEKMEYRDAGLKDDIKRLEKKIDQLLERELNR